MNDMNNKRRALYVIAILANAWLAGLGVSNYGDNFLFIFLGVVFLTSVQVMAKNRMETLYWRKQIWRCDTCGSIITPQSEAVITCRLSGVLKRYDTAECMKTGITGGLD